MVFVPPKDRVFEQSTSNSQTVFTVTGALDLSYNAFSASMSVGDTTIGAVVEPGVAFKAGLLTYSNTNEVTVTTAYDSKGTFSSSGVKQVFMGLPALDALMIDGPQAWSDTRRAQARKNISAVLAGHLYGLTLSTGGGSATFGIAAGEAADSTAVDLLSLGSAYTKTTAAWSLGSGGGALDTGSIAANNFYHVFLIKRPDTGVVDVLVSLSATAPTLPANYTLFRRIGAMRSVAGVVWAGFTQVGDVFNYTAGVTDAAGVTVGASRSTIALTVPPSTRALFRAYMFNSGGAGTGFLIQPVAETDRAPGTYASLFAETANQGAAGHFDILVNASSQIAVRASAASSTAYIETFGWIDQRGRV